MQLNIKEKDKKKDEKGLSYISPLNLESRTPPFCIKSPPLHSKSPSLYSNSPSLQKKSREELKIAPT